MPYVLPALVILALAEIWLLITVGELIGAGLTVLLLILSSVVGLWLVRRAGARAFRALRDAVNTRRAPHRELADGALIFLGGLLMLMPGFISDVLGLLCLLPPTRGLIRRLVFGLAASRLPGPLRVQARRSGLPPRPRSPGAGSAPPTVIEGEVEH